MSRSNKRTPPERGPLAFFFTGAGLSADSGVPTFHGANGLYGRFANPEDIVSAATLRKNPEFLHRFMDDMRVRLRDAAPNDAHLMISRLAAEYGPAVLHMTQNIDDLVERAGFDGSYHLHGFLKRMRSSLDPKITEDIGYTRYWDGDPILAPAKGFQFRGPGKSRFRPDVVLFDEIAPLYTSLLEMVGLFPPRNVAPLGREDIAIVIGTRGTVIDIGRYLSMRACKKVLVNLHFHEEIGEDTFDIVIRDRAALAAGKIEEIVRSHLGHAPVKTDSIERSNQPLTSAP